MSSLYIHIPFCISKCPYCDFASQPGDSAALAGYVDLLLHQLDLWQKRAPQSPFETIFFGGGTPSLLPPDDLARFLDRVADRVGIAPGAEISLEANPGTVDAPGLRRLRSAGIGRISFGIQSLTPHFLSLLGRRHSAEEAIEALRMARDAGFASIGADLMFALPRQSPEAFLGDLDRLLAEGPDHLSIYGLTLEEGTPFADRYSADDLPDDESYRSIWLASRERLIAAGFEQYEIANYARPGHACRHNQVYWKRLPYLGLGPGAHSFLDRGFGERWETPDDLDRFRALLGDGENPACQLESFTREEAACEAAYLALRTAQGIEIAPFIERFGSDPRHLFAAPLQRHARHLEVSESAIRLTPEGWLLYNAIIVDFLAP